MIILKKRKSVISKSVHLFNLLLWACLAVGQAHSSSTSDRYLYRIESTVIGVHDLEVSVGDLKALFCRFPDSLLREWVTDAYLKKMSETVKELKELKKPLDKDNNLIIFLASTRQLFKLQNYISTQEVTLDKELLKALSAPSECPKINWKSEPVRLSFEKWLRLEVYLRSRYAPTGMKSNADWRKRRVESVMQFVDSLDKQVVHENFW